MENISNGSDRLKKEIKNKNIIVKNLVNYYPKRCLTYLGCKNHTFFFGYIHNFFQKIEKIVIQQQFSLNRQSKVIKQWSVAFRNIAFLNDSHEIIAIHDNEMANWKINSCYNLTKSTSFHFCYEYLTFFPDFLDKNSFQLQLGTKDDWIVVEYKRAILFLQKGMEGEWKQIHTMEIQFLEFKLNESGNILIVLLDQKIDVYIQNNFGEWRIAKEMSRCDFCFLDNEQFVVLRNNIITIWQVKPQKFEVVQLQQLKLELKLVEHLYGINYMKFNQLLIVQTRFSIYFIKKKNDNFYFQQEVEIQKQLLVIGPEGLLFNIFGKGYFFDKRARARRIEVLKAYEN